MLAARIVLILVIAGFAVSSWSLARDLEQALLAARLQQALRGDGTPVEDLLAEQPAAFEAQPLRSVRQALETRGALRARAAELERRGLAEAARELRAEELARVERDLEDSLEARFPFPQGSLRLRLLGLLLALAALLATWIPRRQPVTAPNPYVEKILRSVHELVVVVGPRGRILAVNEGACQTLGYSSAELVGQKVELVLGATGELLGRGSYRDVETSFCTAQGQQIPVSLSCSVLTDRAGTVEALVISAQDLSERRRLAETEQRLEALLRAPLLGIAGLDPTGGVIDQNPAFEALLGGRYRGRLVDLLPVEERPRWDSLLGDLFEGRRDTFLLESRLGEAWVNLLVTLRGPEALCLVEDISTRKEAEAEVQKARSRLEELLERLARAGESERRAVARELHDGLLQGIVGAELHLEAHRRVCPQSEERNLTLAHELMREAVAEGRRLLSSLRPALLEHMGLEAALERLLENLRHSYGWKTSLTYQVAVELSPAIETACFRMVQEALSNAQKHSGGQEVAVSVKADPAGWLIEVSDDGRGIPLGRPEGTGLAGMRERAELLGGLLEIHGQPAAGTIIRITLPGWGLSPA